MLPLLAVGAGLLVGGKMMSDMSEAKKLSEEAQKIADEGNENLERIEEIKRDIEDLLKEAYSKLKETKINGLTTLLNNYAYFKDLDLTLGKYEKYRKSLEEEILNNELSITLNDIFSLNNDIKVITSQLGINLDKFYLNQNALVDDIGIETFAGMAAHGIMAAGVGGVATLAGMEFLAATGVGAILLAPIMLSVSGDKVDEAKKALEKAKQFKQETEFELTKWNLSYLNTFVFKGLIETYKYFIEETIDVSNYWIEKYKSDPNNIVTIIKNIITLAYLNKFLFKYPSINQDEMGDFDKLIQWVEDNCSYEQEQIEQLQEEIRKIKEG